MADEARLDSLLREYLVEVPLHPHEALARALLGPHESSQSATGCAASGPYIPEITATRAIDSPPRARSSGPKTHLTP